MRSNFKSSSKLVSVLLILLLACPALAQAKAELVAQAARQQLGQTFVYDPAYVKLDYPGGDIPLWKGVCADVVVRALRAVNIDLQVLIHEDMRANFKSYPQNWGL